MMNWWKANVAWRLARHAPIPMATDHSPRGEWSLHTDCTKCGKPAEDVQFRLCRGCRTRATVVSKKRRKRLARQSRCPKCGQARDDANVVCSGCRAKERARHHERKNKEEP